MCESCVMSAVRVWVDEDDDNIKRINKKESERENQRKI